MNVGLSYLTLNRKANTLSGGETQRINLASSLGSSLVGSTYILDEPSIGLHSRDNDNLIKILKNMGEKGKIAVRNIRREANEELKKKLKDKVISEDQNKNFEKNIQKITDNSIDNIDKILTDKEKEISQI